MSAQRKVRLALIVGLFLLLLTVGSVLASGVVINEFLADLPSGEDENQGEWVELYNSGDESVNLDGWVLKDSIDTHQRIIEGKVIAPGGFSVIMREGANFSLNNSSDMIRLYDATSSGNLIDSYSYASTSEGKTWGRIPDGAGGFVENLEPTKGTPNQASVSPTPKDDSSDENDDVTEQSDGEDIKVEDDGVVEDEDIIGVIAGVKTVEIKSSSFGANLEIGEILPASYSAEIIPIASDEAETEDLGKGKIRWFIAGGAIIILGSVVPMLLKRYNMALWEKIKEKIHK